MLAEICILTRAEGANGVPLFCAPVVNCWHMACYSIFSVTRICNSIRNLKNGAGVPIPTFLKLAMSMTHVDLVMFHL